MTSETIRETAREPKYIRWDRIALLTACAAFHACWIGLAWAVMG